MDRVRIISLGCFRNQVDSEKLLARLRRKGFKIDFSDSRILIINTCAFIEEAKRESIQIIREAIEAKKKGLISKLIVWGCLVERYGPFLHKYFKDIDALVGVMDFSSKERVFLDVSHLSFLKIAEGCSNNCSYCAIPSIRGRLRSRPLEELKEEVRYLDCQRVKELNIVAQDITSWGKDFKNSNLNIVTLLRVILKDIKNIAWIRLLYLHPKNLSDELIDLIASENRICKYIDLPLQHINDRILKLMNRGVDRKYIENLIQKIRKKIPEVSLRTTFIVGFPTEKKSEFEELCQFIRTYRFEHLGAFIYSKEETTEAARLREIGLSKKRERFRKLMSLQKEISSQNNQAFVGRKMQVLVDESGEDYSLARTYAQAYQIDGQVIINRVFRPGQFRKVKIVASSEYDLIGESV